MPLLARHGGHANKFVGDGLLAVFGAPDRLPDHADRAVNTAARVEEATRVTGDDVLLTEATRALLRADHGGFVGRGDAELKGKSERVRLHAPRAAAAPDAPVTLRAI